jgi:hypothetical protein
MAALVIGVAEYPDGNELANPVHDAEDLGAKLKGYGFEVIVATDSTRTEMDQQLKAFRKLLETHDVGLFFFAGHGMQIEGTNYLLATDTDMESEIDAKHSSLSLDRVVDTMAKSKASTKIIILDACRNNPWERAWHRGPGVRGLASVYAPKGTIIGFATSPGELALDGVGRNGTYTAALLEHIDTPDSSIETMFKRVRNTVAAASGGKQTSWEHTSLSGEFYFNLGVGKLIDDYDDTALADGLFVIDPARMSHQIIAGLKKYTWSLQNAALGRLDVASANKMSSDNLFVLGRNIYQAACGTAGTAMDYVENFVDKTRGMAPRRRKAILDGMLFEIFFDPEGRLRPEIKGNSFSEVFSLQRYAELKDSFEFIADALVAARARFYAVPGKGHELSVTVSTKKIDDEVIVQAVYLGGVNILRPEDQDAEVVNGPLRYRRLNLEELKQRLCTELVVPDRLLNLSFTPKSSANEEELLYPRYWTVRSA